MATFDYTRTIISQYANSPILLQLIQDFDQYVDPSVDLEAFYNLIWDVDTAQGYGLDVWGRIVGVTRTISVITGDYFGFNEAGNTAFPWNNQPFFVGHGSTSNYNLSDTAFRTLILAKALSNISDGSIPAINQLLMNLFPGQGNNYVADTGNMTMVYTFAFLLTRVEIAIVTQSGVLPKPTGVSFTINIIPAPPRPFKPNMVEMDFKARSSRRVQQDIFTRNTPASILIFPSYLMLFDARPRSSVYRQLDLFPGSIMRDTLLPGDARVSTTNDRPARSSGRSLLGAQTYDFPISNVLIPP